MAAEFALSDLPPWSFEKEDPADDGGFYAEARLTTHIDDGAIAALTGFYRQALPAGGAVLDLMSSCVSHLPGDVAFAEVIGHGMNAEELAANPQLSRWFIHDLNRDPALPLPDASLDAATICVGVQYLQRPVPVLEELRRVLKPGAPLIVSFSNRCFPTKAVAIWLRLDDRSHAALVGAYLRAAGFTDTVAHVLADGSRCDPLIAVVGRA
ncbi:MAG TPA: methyltransferase domain-containing protein [Caulobacteraceae bacterium]|jgi:SAM-dependent methyltransferase|nr:methyltransferase domain-containing protein [Caulobacteraceae bacterium]